VQEFQFLHHLIRKAVSGTDMLTISLFTVVLSFQASKSWAAADTWSIELVADSTETKTENNAAKIVQDYLVGNIEDVRISVYSYDCLATDSISMFTPAFDDLGTIDSDGDEKHKISVSLDVDSDKIAGSDFWNDETNILSFCAKVELFESDISISFYETQVTLNIEMTVNYETDPIATAVTSTAMDTLYGTHMEKIYSNLWYDINGCMCESLDTYDAEAPPCLAENAGIMQNQEFSICLEPSKDDVKIKNVLSLNLTQNGVLKSTPVDEGNSDALTKIQIGSGGYYVITTWAISAFFMDDIASDMTGNGKLELEFQKGSDSSRKLRALSEESGSFDVTVHLSNDENLLESGGVELMYRYAWTVQLLFSWLWFL